MLGAPGIDQLARRFRLDGAEVRELLLDAQASGWVGRYDFLGHVTWAMTEAGKAEEERLLAAELDAVNARQLVAAVHADFLPLNAEHGRACTDWQLRPQPWDALAANDHTDFRWDSAVLDRLDRLDSGLAALCTRLTAALSRFAGYAEAHEDALLRARTGEPAWVDAPDRASCQLVWIQFHEDLLATLGIPRGSDS